MKWIKSLLLNLHTLGILIISILSCFIAIKFQLKIQHNLMLFGLIISFPLVFSLQSAFKRRDRALEYLSIFNSSLTSICEAFQQAGKLQIEKKNYITEKIQAQQLNFYEYLKSGNQEPAKMLASFNLVSAFMISERKEIDERLMLRVGRYMKDVYESANFLASIKTHRTIVGVRILAYVFISIFPVIQAQFLLNSFGNELPQWSIYLISFFTSLTLSALLLIQKQLEDPFSQEGLDNIHFETFVPK